MPHDSLIREFRLRAKLTQVQVSIHCRVSLTTVSKWERGRDSVSTMRVAQLAALFRLDAVDTARLYADHHYVRRSLEQKLLAHPERWDAIEAQLSAA